MLGILWNKLKITKARYFKFNVRLNSYPAVFAENRLINNAMTQLFLWHCNRPYNRVYHYIYFRFYVAALEPNVHVTGFATISIVAYAYEEKI